MHLPTARCGTCCIALLQAAQLAMPSSMLCGIPLHANSPVTGLVQTFLQRTHNYLQAWLMRLFVMRLSKSYIRQFVAQTGQHMRSLETGRSAASAVVASVDWSVEYPFPLPPKIQVHLLMMQWFAMSCLIPKLSKHMSHNCIGCPCCTMLL